MNDRRALRLAVVIQTPRDPHSAVYIAYASLATALQACGHSVEIVAPSDFGMLHRLSGRWVPLAYPVAIRSWLRRRRRDFDLVMCHSYAGWLAYFSGRQMPRSMVMFHGLEPLYHEELRRETMIDGHDLSWRYRLLQEILMPFMLKTACRAADVVVCYNRAESLDLSARGWAPAARVRVLAHGVPREFFAAPRTWRPIQTMLFVGQWLPMKGIRYLREAATRLLSGNPSLGLICAGTLASPEVVLSGFPDSIRSQVTILPRVDPPELVRLYRDADVFLFPSLYEGFSRAIVEAMAARLPIVSTCVGVAADALRDGQNALIIPKRDADAIVSAVERLCADPITAMHLGTLAGETALGYALEPVTQLTMDAIMEAALGTP